MTSGGVRNVNNIRVAGAEGGKSQEYIWEVDLGLPLGHCWLEGFLAAGQSSPQGGQWKGKNAPCWAHWKAESAGERGGLRNQPLQEEPGRSGSFVTLSLTGGSCGLQTGRGLLLNHCLCRGAGGEGPSPSFPFSLVALDSRGEWTSNLLKKFSCGS